MTYIFDVCALIAFLNDERGKGYEPVRDLLDRANKEEISLCMSLCLFFGFNDSLTPLVTQQ